MKKFENHYYHRYNVKEIDAINDENDHDKIEIDVDTQKMFIIKQNRKSNN